MNNSRRTFIRQCLVGSAGLAAGLPLLSSAKGKTITLTILHTNDVHSHLDPFPANDPLYPGLGGVSRRAALIQEFRKQHENVLLLDAGDIFQGTPYFNIYKGELDFKLMSAMQYDAATLGNHDFDNGLQGLHDMLPYANFPFINCNYDFTDTLLEGKILPYKIFEKQSLRIGVLGVGVELNGLVDKRLYGNTKYLNPIEKANETAVFLKEKKKCDVIILLSHLGYQYAGNKVSDRLLAANSRNIDVIIGGHTHTFLHTDVRVNNLDNKPVTICQAGWAGIQLGVVSCTFSKNRSERSIKSGGVKIF